MPEIQIRPVNEQDIPNLITINHHCTSDFVWQMDFQHQRNRGQVMINFREIRLPRPTRVEYPRSPRLLLSDWEECSGILIASLNERVIGYTAMMLTRIPGTTWVTDLVVDRENRRQGIGSALLLAASEWALHMDTHNLVLEMQPKNYPAIQMALKLGFEFCGYNDRYYDNHEIGIFFSKSLR